MAENPATVSDSSNLTPAQIRAEITAARSRISGNIDAIETHVWQRVSAAVGGAGDRRKVSRAESALSALLLAERVGVFRYLSARFRRRAT